MRILFFNSISVKEQRGGAERSVFLLAEGLARLHGHEVSIACLSTQLKTLSAAYTHGGVGHHLLRIPNIYNPFEERTRSVIARAIFNIVDIVNPISFFWAAAIVFKRRPCIISTHMLKGISLAPWVVGALLRIPVLATLREYDLLYSGSSFRLSHGGPQPIPLLWVLKRLGSDLVDGVIALSRATLSRHIELGYFRRAALVAVIGNSFEKTTEGRRAGEGRRLRIGYLGRLQVEKGIDVFLDSAHVLRKSAKFQFYVAGRGDSIVEQRLATAAKNCDIIYKGWRKPEEFLPALDILVVPSLWPEPFGRTVLEGWSYGCFVVSSNRGGLPEVNRNPRTGCVYDGSVEGLVAVLTELEKSKRWICERSAFDAQLDQFSISEIALRHNTVLASLDARLNPGRISIT